jgi:hypothetical protein
MEAVSYGQSSNRLRRGFSASAPGVKKICLKGANSIFNL